MKFPTETQVELADREMLGIWCRFLPIPSSQFEKKMTSSIFEKFLSKGGWDPTLSRKVGWNINKIGRLSNG